MNRVTCVVAHIAYLPAGGVSLQLLEGVIEGVCRIHNGLVRRVVQSSKVRVRNGRKEQIYWCSAFFMRENSAQLSLT